MSRIALAFWWWVLLIALTPVQAEPEEQGNTVKSKPEIQVQLIDPSEKIAVGNPIRIKVTVKNGSGSIELKGIAVSPPQTLRLSLNNNQERPFNLIIPNKRDRLKSGDSLEFGEVYLDGPSLLARKNWDLLTYRPKKEVILVELSYVILEGDIPAIVFQTLEVDIFASPLGLFAGAIVGTLLGTLFVALIRVQKAVEVLSNPKLKEIAPIFGKEAGRAVFLFFKAIIAAGIVILVLQSASGVKFPIEVSVNDFYGGLVMGLIGERIATIVYEWITKP